MEHTTDLQGRHGPVAGIAEPDLATSVAHVYDHSEPASRARLLNTLLPAVGPLALAVLGSGVFAKYLTRTRWQEVSVTLEDAARISGDHLMGLVRYVEQSDVSVIERVCSMLAEQSATVPALTVAAVALGMHVIQQRRQRRPARGGPLA